MISETDVARMVEACRLLPEPDGDYLEDDFLVNLVATVIDFQTQTSAVERAIAHFRREVLPHLRDIDDLQGLLERWPADQPGNTALAEHLSGYKMWSRAQMLRDLVAYFVTLGVTDQASLKTWAASAAEAVAPPPEVAPADRPLTVAPLGLAEGLVTFVDDDPGYIQWVRDHPDGFVLNSYRRPTANYLVLHRARCYSINPAWRPGDARSWTVAYRRPAPIRPTNSSAGQRAGLAQPRAALCAIPWHDEKPIA